MGNPFTYYSPGSVFGLPMPTAPQQTNTAAEAFASQGTPLGPVDPNMTAYLKNWRAPTMPSGLTPQQQYAWQRANTSTPPQVQLPALPVVDPNAIHSVGAGMPTNPVTANSAPPNNNVAMPQTNISPAAQSGDYESLIARLLGGNNNQYSGVQAPRQLSLADNYASLFG